MEVWLAYLRFQDHPDVGKVRPVLLVDRGRGAHVVAKITTAAPTPGFSYCPLDDWREEGLLYPSIVQVDPLFTIEDSDLLRGRPLGWLTRFDEDAVRRLLR